MVDWDTGSYEFIARQLWSVSDHVVATCAPLSSETIVDLGCGTGNASLLLAASGARVIGVDPSPRLRTVAQRAALDAGLTVEFLSGRAEEIPVADGVADAVVSTFALIFASDPTKAAQEISRVLTSRGRLFFTAWSPLAPMAKIRREVMTPALDEPAEATPFAWHDHDDVASIFEPLGFSVTLSEGSVNFTGASTRDFVTEEWEHNPFWVAARQRLRELGTFEEVDAQLVEHFGAANAETSSFSMASPYVLFSLRRTSRASTAI